MNLTPQSFELDLSSNSPTGTQQIGELIGTHLSNGMVLLLLGNLGAGKTTLTRGIAKGWGSTMRVTSPTFKLVNIYSRPTDSEELHHLDCYRLNSSDEGETIGLGEILGDGGPVIIEWPEIIEDWLPAKRISIRLTPPEDFGDDRQMTIRAVGDLYRPLMEQLATFKGDYDISS